MKMTKKQGKALEMAFNSGIVRNMTPEEYKGYIQQLFALAMETTRANEGDKFVSDFVNAGLSSPPNFKTQQVAQH